MWYVEESGWAEGPYKTESISNMIEQGTISSQTLVWKKGMAEWIALFATDIWLKSQRPMATPMAPPQSKPGSAFSEVAAKSSTLPSRSGTRKTLTAPHQTVESNTIAYAGLLLAAGNYVAVFIPGINMFAPFIALTAMCFCLIGLVRADEIKGRSHVLGNTGYGYALTGFILVVFQILIALMIFWPW